VNSRVDTARPKKALHSNTIADVAVIGGGIVGAAAALAAAQAGLSTVWITGQSSPPQSTAAPSNADRDLRVYALSPSTQQFLERLRVWSQLDASRMAPVFDMRIYGDRQAHGALHFGAYEAATERLASIVEHRELARVLGSAAAYFPGVERIDALASQVGSDADHAIVVTNLGTRIARVVIAADGAQSATRAAFGIAMRGKPYGQRALVGNFACARPHGGAAFQWFTDEGVIALLPLASSADAQCAMSLVWSAPDAIADRFMREPVDVIASRLSELCSASIDSAIGPLTSLGPLVDIPLVMQWAESTTAPRAALVGDAAHVIHPLAGQGLNLGFADVEALIDVLARRETFRDCGDPVLLRRYARMRAGPVMAMRRMTDGLARLFEADRPGLARMRTLGMSTLDRITPLKRLLMRQASGNALID
jgi:2-polyprenylphenol 6-hydroxylase